MKLKLVIIIMSILVLITVLVVIYIVMRRGRKYQIIKEQYEENLEMAIPSKRLRRKNKSYDDDRDKIRVLTDYNQYKMTKEEKFMWSIIGMIAVFGIGYIFYKDVIWAFLLSLIGLWYPKIKNEEIIKIRKEKLLLQFKESLYAISASLTAGKSVENSFRDADEEIALIFGDGKEIYILEELRNINRKLEMGFSIEEALKDLSERSGLEEIKTFTDIFEACNRTGGNLNRVIQNSCQVIGEKIEIKQEISVLISGKKFEAKILTFIPFILIILMQFMAPDLLQNLYTTVGRIMATIALVIIGVAILWSNKIMDIEV